MTDTDPTDYGPHDGSLDANAIAGLLHEIFGAEMTITACRCAHCGNRAQIGSLRLYGMAGPGMVLRCSACSEMIMRIMRRPDGSYLVDARGAAYLRI